MPVKSVHLPAAGRTVKLGRRKPAAPPLVPRLKHYLRRAAPTPPAAVDYGKAVASWPVYLNDRLGDCVIADGGHEIQSWAANESGTAVTFTDGQIQALYAAIGGYVPGDPATDNGCLITDMLDYLRATGYPGGHTTGGYVAVDNGNKVEAQTACYLFGSLTLGVDLPDSWIETAADGGTWAPDTPNPQNGHCVPVVGYDARGVQIVTWGMVVTILWEAFTDRAIVTECYASVSNDWATGAKPAPNGVSMAALLADLKMLGQGELPPLPDPTPPAPPVPVPPSPPAPPTPTPAVWAIILRIVAWVESLFGRRLARSRLTWQDLVARVAPVVIADLLAKKPYAQILQDVLAAVFDAPTAARDVAPPTQADLDAVIAKLRDDQQAATDLRQTVTAGEQAADRLAAVRGTQAADLTAAEAMLAALFGDTPVTPPPDADRSGSAGPASRLVA